MKTHTKIRRLRSKLRKLLVKATLTVMGMAVVVGAFLQWLSTLELTDNHIRALWILVLAIFLGIAWVHIVDLARHGIQRSAPKREKVERFWRDRKPEDRNKHGAPFDMDAPNDGAYWGHADYWQAAKDAREREKKQSGVDHEDDISDVGVGRALMRVFRRAK